VFTAYPNYESDEHGEYTYFLGEKVHDVKNIQQDFETLVIPG
jgi:predicted transcriptional regulator YdeE